MMNEKNTLQCCWSRPRILFLILALLLFSKQTYAQVLLAQLDMPDDVTEDDGVIQACVVLNRQPDVDVTVTINTQDVTATAPSDYSAASEELIFTNSSSTRACIDIEIIQDGVVESIQYFDVFLNSDDISASDDAFVVIYDSDEVTISFDQNTYTTSEATPASVCAVIVSGELERPVQFSLQADGGSASPTNDYLPFEYERTFEPANQNDPVCAHFAVFPDQTIEGRENFQVFLSSLDGAVNVVGSSAIVQITDDDGATVMLQTTAMSVNEVDSGALTSVQLCIVLEDVLQGLERDVVITLTTTVGTAGLDDFEVFENRALVIPSATRVDEAVCSTINILGDDVRESDEVFSIMAATADPNDSIVGLNSFTITIIDNGDVLAECDILANPISGVVTFISRSEGSMATYNCSVGFSLRGTPNRICGSDGQWSGEEPTCNSVDCGTLPDPIGGTVILNGTVFGSQAVYTCGGGSTLVGDDVRLCQADEQWSGNAPNCSSIPEDDTNVVPIAVGVSIGGFVVIVTIAVIVAVVAIRKRMMYEKYVLPYRSYVKPYTVYANKRESRFTDAEIELWERERGQRETAPVQEEPEPEKQESGNKAATDEDMPNMEVLI